MVDRKSPAEFDDELLSAYLDDELAPDERARVEQRLAADPAAQKMLDQLRAVSQAMQGMPREAVGEDLRGPVLQQAERAMLTSETKFPRLAEGPDSRPSPAGSRDDSLPPFSIGRTPRGW